VPTKDWTESALRLRQLDVQADMPALAHCHVDQVVLFHTHNRDQVGQVEPASNTVKAVQSTQQA
jgi:hypothetical protein